jgi:hypothetical protein
LARYEKAKRNRQGFASLAVLLRPGWFQAMGRDGGQPRQPGPFLICSDRQNGPCGGARSGLSSEAISGATLRQRRFRTVRTFRSDTSKSLGRPSSLAQRYCRGASCLRCLNSIAELIRYMRQWNSRLSRLRQRSAKTIAFVVEVQFGSGTELVPLSLSET